MKSIKSLSILGLILLSSIFVTSENYCYFIQRKFRICKNFAILSSVVETNQDKESNLRHPLHIIEKEITTIPPNAFKNVTIYHLILEFAEGKLFLNQESFTGLPRLRILEFFSGILTLQENLFLFIKSLTKLSLIIDGRNQNFENAFSELSDLNTLRVFESNITNVTESTFKNFSPRIIVLELINNNIRNIFPNSFVNLEYLKYLKIENNKLTALPSGIFSGLDHLASLTISWNKLKIIPNNTLNNFKKLKKLYIDQNLIDTIDDRAFTGLNLTILDLSQNKIFTINPKIFQGLSTETLDLSGNEIVRISNGGFLSSYIKNLCLPHSRMRIMRATWGISQSTNIFINGKLLQNNNYNNNTDNSIYSSTLNLKNL